MRAHGSPSLVLLSLRRSGDTGLADRNDWPDARHVDDPGRAGDML